MNNKNYKFDNTLLKRLLLYIITAVIATFIGIFVFKSKEIAPFGSKSVLCMDLWGQYFPMYLQNAQANSLSELFYSWNGAFGHNNWAQSAYYCNSIFLLLFKVIPLSNMVTAIDIFCIAKITFASLTCLAFLEHKLKNTSPILAAAAIAYGLCAYMLAFMSQFMWTDALIYTPLVLLGIDRLVYDNKPVFYSIMLAATIISSFYIGFAVCIFCVLYFIAEASQLMDYSLNRKKILVITNKTAFFNAVLRFVLFSALAGALAAVFIFPVGKAISLTLAAEMKAPDKFEWYNDITAVLQDLFDGRNLYVEYTGQNIAVGMAVFAAVPLYFLNNNIRKAERIANFILLVFLLISFNCNIMNYVWHGFHFPNQLPARWSFLFSLFAVYLMASGLTKAVDMKPMFALISGVISILTVIITANGLGDTESITTTTDMWIVVGIVLISGIALSLIGLNTNSEKLSRQQRKRQEKNKAKINIQGKNSIVTVIACIASVIMILDSAGNFNTVSKYEGNKGLQTSDEPGYTEAIERSTINGENHRSKNDTFYRVEANNGFTFNASMIGGYRGMRYYSSTMQGSVYNLLRYLGNRVYADRVSSVYSLSSPVQNTLFGLKCYMDFSRNLDRELPFTSITEDNEEGLFRENTQPLSLAYAVSEKALDWEITDEVRAIKNQSDLLDSMLGEPSGVFEKIKTSAFSFTNATLSESSNWNTNYFNTTDISQPVTFHYAYKAENDGNFFMEHNYRAGKIHISSPFGQKDTSIGNGTFCYLGELKKGETVNIDVTLENIQTGCCGLDVYSFNKENWDKAYSKLAEHQMEVTSFNNTDIAGNISLDNDSLVFASIPQDGGWSVYCDGKKVDTLKIADALIGVRIPSGNHKLRFKYTVPGIIPGTIITVLGIIAIAVYIFIRKKGIDIYRRAKTFAHSV